MQTPHYLVHVTPALPTFIATSAWIRFLPLFHSIDFLVDPFYSGFWLTNRIIPGVSMAQRYGISFDPSAYSSSISRFFSLFEHKEVMTSLSPLSLASALLATAKCSPPTQLYLYQSVAICAMHCIAPQSVVVVFAFFPLPHLWLWLLKRRLMISHLVVLFSET